MDALPLRQLAISISALSRRSLEIAGAGSAWAALRRLATMVDRKAARIEQAQAKQREKGR